MTLAYFIQQNLSFITDKNGTDLIIFYILHGFVSEAPSTGGLAWCGDWKDPQHVLFQLANVSFLISYLAPSSRHGRLFMHATLILGKSFRLLVKFGLDSN